MVVVVTGMFPKNGKFFVFEISKLGMLVSVCFEICLGVALAAPKGVSKRMGFKMASFLIFEKCSLSYPFVLIPVWIPPISGRNKTNRQKSGGTPP